MNILEKEGLTKILYKHISLIEGLIESNTKLRDEKKNVFLDSWQEKELRDMITEKRLIIKCIKIDR